MPDAHFISPRPQVPFPSISHLLEYHAERNPDAPAILAPGSAPLGYGRLHRHVEQMGQKLRTMGIGRHERVAVTLPNGPEMAVAILTVEAYAVCAPLNPAYESDELGRYLADLRPSALIAAAGVDSPARRVALSQGLRIIELSTTGETEAGLFTLMGEPECTSSHEPATPNDLALLLPTSGTTSRPKLVPLTHGNVCTAAYNAGTALALNEADRCLNVLPLFHGHCLNATVLATLSAGASLVCTAGLDLDSFFAWLTSFRPTWYAAVPTMHQAILARVRQNRERVADCRLRFIRSAAAPLPRRVLTELERTFETSVIEYYAMTETASSPIACSPMPPRQHKLGSVGVVAGLDVAIMDDQGTLVPRGQTGQVVVRGASVMSGYDGNPMANQAAFEGGWFKTGDHGFFDDDAYLFLVGRKQEIINRGGEKIAPREIDEALAEHPAVAEAATFAVPHPTLGEDVASAVVLWPQAKATPTDIRRFVVGRVADFKVPREVFIVNELPVGPTGKVQRVGLAAKLGLTSDSLLPQDFVAPRAPLEKLLAECWAEILQVGRVGIHDNFFALGGDSLSVTRVLAAVYEITHAEIDISRFFEAPTVGELAQHLETLIQAGETARAFSAVARTSCGDGVPASIAQERIWKLQRALPGIPFFNIFSAFRLTSAVDPDVLERSFNGIVQRHEILRTTFAVVNGQCVQVVSPQFTLRLTFDDLSGLPESERETAGHRAIQDEILHDFDLVRGPLLRARLVRLLEREHLLLTTMHQIVADGWSLGVLVDELVALYDAFATARPSPLVPLPIQFVDFAHWQRQWDSHPAVTAQIVYWREQLREPLPDMKLAAACPRPTVDGLHTAERERALSPCLSGAVKRFSHREGGTLFMALVAALKTLLHRYLGQEDIRVATLVANRNRPGTKSLIGPLVNTIILRTNLGGDPSLGEVMHRVRATVLAAFAHQDLAFEDLVEFLERERGLKAAALSRVMIVLHNATLRPIRDDGHMLTLEEANPNMLLPMVTATTFDLMLMIHESNLGLMMSCVYKSDLFDAMTVDHLLGDFQLVLEEMVTQPERPISAILVAPGETA